MGGPPPSSGSMAMSTPISYPGAGRRRPGRLPDVATCPEQFQQMIEGHDVRAHVVGDEVFATEVRADAPDYRYTGRFGAEPPRMTAIELEPDLARRCVGLTRASGLEVAGVDLRISPDGVAYCIEVNTSPAFSWYEQRTGQPIAAAIARLLADG